MAGRARRWLEVRRHSITKKGEGRGKGSHLSAEGVLLARRIGRGLGPFHLVLTSCGPRSMETAIAMGFSVDEQWEALGEIPPEVFAEVGHHERWGWEQPFVTFAQMVRRGGATAAMGRRQLEAWTAALGSVPDGGTVLVISHGRVIEAGLVTAVPDGEFAAWGIPFRHGEGVLLGYDAGRFTVVEFLRVGE